MIVLWNITSWAKSHLNISAFQFFSSSSEGLGNDFASMSCAMDSLLSSVWLLNSKLRSSNASTNAELSKWFVITLLNTFGGLIVVFVEEGLLIKLSVTTSFSGVSRPYAR